MAENVFEVTDANFKQEVLDSPTPVLVDFWAAWCGPCRSLAPTMEQFAAEKAGVVKVCKIDVDGNPGVAGQYGIRSIPTILLFKGGQNIGQLVGNVPKGAIEELTKKAV
ncbi:MAG TPA: thioredoxin [bacterium]|nr:thioredoxin [bacterium]